MDHPEQVTLVADSGATFYLNGAKREVRRLSEAEKEFLGRIDERADALKVKVQVILTELGFNRATCPDLYIEPKAIAKNVHYREVLIAYDQPDGSELDQRISAVVKAELQKLIQDGPQEIDGSLTFKTLDGPATVEVKVASVNKGHGLQAIIEAAAQSHTPPTAVIFTGDDLSKGNGTPGTDYFAMVRAPYLAELYGIPIYTIHTHHPERGKLDGTDPDERISIATLSEQYPAPNIDLRVPTPTALAEVILSTYKAVIRNR